MAEILGKGLSQGVGSASLPAEALSLVRCLVSPLHPSIVIPGSLLLLFRADAILFNVYKASFLGLSAPS